MKGKLIVLEGTDGSGKSTQFTRLCNGLKDRGIEFVHASFPRYNSQSSALIKMYLGGEFGTAPSDVNAYAASTFYAADRFASYKQDWGKYYEQGGLVICDRYTTSNAYHQASKLPNEDRDAFFQWLYDFEFGKLGLPKPDAVIYLDVDTNVSIRNLRSREASTNTKADIHEVDGEYLGKCHIAARQAAKALGWDTVQCCKDSEFRSIDDISSEVMADVLKVIK